MNRNRLPGIRRNQCQLLVASSRNEDTVAATEEHIRGLAGGQAPHRYAALSLSFRIAVEEKRGNPSVGTTGGTFPTGPTLHCSNQGCSQNSKPLFVRDIGGKTVCQTCRWRLKCYVCGHYRKAGKANCSGCRNVWN